MVYIMKYLSKIWGPHYWFVLHTIALRYPKKPNDVTKKKYYDLISNFPLFIPDTKIGDEFAELLDKYPVTPYLDNNNTFSKWMHFIHNRINEKINKPTVTYNDFLEQYYSLYKPKEEINRENFKHREKLIYGGILLIVIISIYIIYKK
ncbi:Erv1/Alr family FAD-linked sulfhydryl oxidase [bacterium]|nr:Erv1/Alr family FAD-linked sulfhydryl oxidase [bacterium]